jgi:hypothetical protein
MKMTTIFLAWSAGKSIGIVVFPALTVLGNEVVFLEPLNPAGYVPFEILKNS